jgi:hypothetical protein
VRLEKAKGKAHILQKQQFIGLLYGMVMGCKIVYFAWGVDASVPVASTHVLPRTVLILGLNIFFIAGCVAGRLTIHANTRLLALGIRTPLSLCYSHSINWIPFIDALYLIKMRGKSNFKLLIAPTRDWILILSPKRRWCLLR